MKSYFYTSIPTFFLLSIIVIISGITRATNDDSQWLAAEAKALMETGWWSNYTTRVGDRCMWPGIQCNAGSVVVINLSGHGLNGGITPQIGSLSNIRYLDLSNNSLVGPIPSSVSNLTNLWYLSMASNLLEGPIPREIESLNALEYLDLSYNKLSGPIPTQI
ncbi:hypothetical protein Godav_025680, partial [Gossypium davidsonii]|nr:hypothetical protein [Gossypium davidsonii]